MRCLNKTKYASAFFSAAALAAAAWALVVCAPAAASIEALRTSRVRVGEAAPLEGPVKEAHDGGKAVVLLLLANPIQCNGCEEVGDAIAEATTRRAGSVAFISRGGGNMLGGDEETVSLKKLYGFVTVGEPWTFVIDRGGILRKILIGKVTAEEIGTILDGLKGGDK